MFLDCSQAELKVKCSPNVWHCIMILLKTILEIRGRCQIDLTVVNPRYFTQTAH